MRSVKHKKPAPATLAEMLKKLRDENGITQVELCTIIHICQGSYSNYERGFRTPKPETLYRIARYYGIPASMLLRYITSSSGETTYDTKEYDSELDEAGEKTVSGITETSPVSLTGDEKKFLYYCSKLDKAGLEQVITMMEFKHQLKAGRV